MKTMKTIKTILIIFATILIGLIVVNMAFRIAILGAFVALILVFGLIGYVLAKLLLRHVDKE